MTPAQAHALREGGREHGLGGHVPAPHGLGEHDPGGHDTLGHVLDNPVWAALSGPHARFAVTAAGGTPPRAARYPSDVAPFAALADPADPRSWDDLAVLAGSGALTGVSGTLTVPEGWETVASIPGVQLVDTSLRTEADPEAVRLGPADVPEVLDASTSRSASPCDAGPPSCRCAYLDEGWHVSVAARARAGMRVCMRADDCAATLPSNSFHAPAVVYANGPP